MTRNFAKQISTFNGAFPLPDRNFGRKTENRPAPLLNCPPYLPNVHFLVSGQTPKGALRAGNGAGAPANREVSEGLRLGIHGQVWLHLGRLPVCLGAEYDGEARARVGPEERRRVGVQGARGEHSEDPRPAPMTCSVLCSKELAYATLKSALRSKLGEL